ncbi:MAG: ABC transporter permease subunit [Holosporaceae bacterium]|jgi:putrescine transport system permease protein|nr:ABC transporter permease subunit [Holosporaceae bacterium]
MINTMYRTEERVISWFAGISKKVSGRHFLISIPFIWIFLFFICPCLILIEISLSESIIASPPYTPIVEWLSGHMLQIRMNLENYMVLFTDEMYIRGFITSVLIAGVSTVCCLLIGFPMAYAIARASEHYRRILLMLVVLPFWTSFLIRVYAWMMLLSPSGFINTLLMKFHLIEAPLPLINNSFAACIGIIYAYLPFMIFPLYNAIEKIDYSLLEAAYDLGSSPMTAFFSIVMPLSAPGIYAGSALVFVPAIGEFVIPELLGGSQTLTIGRLVWNEFFGSMSWPTAAALSIVLLVFVVFPIVFIQRCRETKFLSNNIE